jgi:hypothetical protein
MCLPTHQPPRVPFPSCHRARCVPILASILVVLVTTAFVLPAWGRTIRHVPSEYATIQAAVTAAQPGDSILIAPGTYTGVGNRDVLVGQKVIYVRGVGGPGSVVIDAEDLANGISFAEAPGYTSSLRGVTIRHGNPYGIHVYDNSPTFSDCRLESCRTGALLADYDGMLIDSTIEGCQNVGIMISGGSVCTVRNTEIRSNDGEYGAGIQIISASPTIENCIISGNDAIYDGGGIYAEDSAVSLSYVALTGNRALVTGGGIRLLTTTLQTEHTTISRNITGQSGAGVSCPNSDATFGHTILWGNCTGAGGREILVDPGSSARFVCSAVDQTGVSGAGTIVYETSAIFNDPLFCDMGPCPVEATTAGNFYLASGSPCYGGSCGYIGKFINSCEFTRTEGSSWGRIKALFR